MVTTNLYRNKKTGQFFVVLPKKKFEFLKKNNPKKVDIKVKKWQ